MTESKSMRRGMVTSPQGAVIAAIAGIGTCLELLKGMPMPGGAGYNGPPAGAVLAHALIPLGVGGIVSGVSYIVLTRRRELPAETYSSNPFDPNAGAEIERSPTPLPLARALARPPVPTGQSATRWGPLKVFLMINALSMVLFGLAFGGYAFEVSHSAPDFSMRIVMLDALASAAFGLLPGLLLSIPAAIVVWLGQRDDR